MIRDFLYFGAIISLVVLVVVISFLDVKDRNNYVKAENCHKPLGEFGVENGYFASGILNRCFDEGNKQCIFPNVPNLTTAVQLCNENISFCDRFNYSSATNSMSIVGLTGAYSANLQNDVYTRQVSHN